MIGLVDTRSSIKLLSGLTSAFSELFNWAARDVVVEEPLPNSIVVGVIIEVGNFSLQQVVSRKKLSSAPLSNRPSMIPCPSSQGPVLALFIAFNSFRFLMADDNALFAFLMLSSGVTTVAMGSLGLLTSLTRCGGAHLVAGSS